MIAPTTNVAVVAVLLPHARALVPFLLTTRQDGMLAALEQLIATMERANGPLPADELHRIEHTLVMCESQIATWGNA